MSEAPSLKIEKIETNKHKIKQRVLMEAGIIPNHPCISLFSASAGSGKTNLIVNLLRKPEFYGKSMELIPNDGKHDPAPYFDAIFLMLNSSDDLFESLVDDDIIKQNHICLKPQPEDVQKILDEQKNLIEMLKGKLHLAPKILVVFDDCVSNQPLLRSEPFLRLMTANRHYNASVFFTTQYINLVPRSLRLQASFVFAFKCNRTELQVLSEQYCPPSMTLREFAQLVQDATRDDERSKHNFLLISKKAPEDQRFRKNLDEFITLKRHGYTPKIKEPTKKEIDDLDYEIEETQKALNQEYKKPAPFSPDMPEVAQKMSSSNKGRGRPMGSKTRTLHKTASLPAGVNARRIRNPFATGI